MTDDRYVLTLFGGNITQFKGDIVQDPVDGFTAIENAVRQLHIGAAFTRVTAGQKYTPFVHTGFERFFVVVFSGVSPHRFVPALVSHHSVSQLRIAHWHQKAVFFFADHNPSS
jgi:hypothetical protein